MGDPVMQQRNLQKLGREVAEELDAMRDETVLPQTRRRLFEGGARAPVRAGATRRPVVLVGAIGLAAAAVVALVITTRGPAPMAFHVGEQSGEVGKQIAAPAAAPAGLRFADGTRFDLEATGRARVMTSTAARGHLLLERGRLSGEIVAHDGGPTWTVTAGRYELTVSGRFVVAWDPDREELDVRDVSDRVVVKGPLATEGVTVRKGEQVRVSVPAAKLEVSAAVPPGPAPSK